MSLRDTMPDTALLIDSLREAFGPDSIDCSIRRGTKGEANHFHATEGDETCGTAFEKGHAFRPYLPPKEELPPVTAKKRRR